MHPLAGKPAPHQLLCDLPRLLTAYYMRAPEEPVAFGTSGHRGSSLKGSFNELHILAIAQAIAELRKPTCSGPLFLGKDTHALSEPAEASAIEVLVANGVEVVVAAGGGYTPTPVVSHAILTYNRNRSDRIGDGVVITPSHNPPEDGGFKYNPPHGGPAEDALTKKIEARANELIAHPQQIKRMPYAKARALVKERDFVTPYVADLGTVIDMHAIAKAQPKIGVDPMGGSGIAYWGPIAEKYRLDLEVVNPRVDATFSFMTLDHDGKIRMDCSSPYAMASLIQLADRFDIAFGNDTDFDRHGIVTKGSGLMNPNHYLSVAIEYLFTHRGWPAAAAVGKTLVSSSMIDRVAKRLGRTLSEVPVGFKWFVEGLLHGSYGFGGEESAGASFLRRDGRVWTTDKDGFILDLLAAEMLSVTGRDPALLYRDLTSRFGDPVYERIDAPATPEQKSALKSLAPEAVTASQLAGEPIIAKLTAAPGNGASIGGLKVVTENGWFAARPSGTENVYKIYTESFLGRDHLARIQEEARSIVAGAFASTP